MADTLPPLPAGAKTETTPPLPPGAVSSGGDSSFYPSYTPEKSGADRLKEIGSSGLTGAGLGAITPEILTYGGGAVSMFGLPEVGVPMMYTGRAMRGARLASAGAGLVSGTASGAARQYGEMRGWSEPKTTAIELVAGGFAPEAWPLLKYGLKKAVASAGFATKSDISEAMNAVAQSIGKDLSGLTPKQRDFIAKKLNEIRGGPRTTEPATKTMEGVRTGVEQDVAAARARAAQTRQQAQLRSTERDTALANAETQRFSIGSPKSDDAIGTELRDNISGRQKLLSKERSAQFDADNAIVQNEVNGKEGSGVFIANDPDSKPLYDSLISKLRNQLLIGQTALKQPTAPVTESGIVGQLQRIYDSVRLQRKQIGTTEEGEPIYKSFPVSFNALDDVRRKLGDVAFGRKVEGYDAIGAKLAGELYRDLSEIQGAFAPAKKELIANYEEASRTLDVFKTLRGKRAIQEEKFDPERFVTDPSKLPGVYFSSRQGVKDLIELVGGNKNLVYDSAKSYVSRQLEGKSASQVASYIRANQWMDEVPGLSQSVRSYERSLAKAEGIPTAEKVIAAGEKEAVGIEKQAEAQAKSILSDRNAVARVADMITGKTSETLLPKVAQYIASQPGGRETFVKAVGVALADSTPATIKKTFTDNVRPAVEKSGLMTKAELDRLEGLVDEIDRTVQTKEKVNRIVKVVNQALIGQVSSRTSGLTQPLYGGLFQMLSPF